MNLFWYFIVWTIVYAGIVRMFNPKRHYDAVIALYVIATPLVLLIAAGGK